MPQPAVDALLFLLDEAFEGRGIEESKESQALLTNLATVDETTWHAKPPGATRTFESMVLHVAGCKIMYADHAFGAGTKTVGYARGRRLGAGQGADARGHRMAPRGASVFQGARRRIDR